MIASADVAASKQKFLISASARRADGVHVRVLAGERPGVDASLAEPTLEDAYLHCIFQPAHGGRGMSQTVCRWRVLYHLAHADFLERVRRYSFLVTMGFALYFGYLRRWAESRCGYEATFAESTIRRGLER